MTNTATTEGHYARIPDCDLNRSGALDALFFAERRDQGQPIEVSFADAGNHTNYFKRVIDHSIGATSYYVQMPPSVLPTDEQVAAVKARIEVLNASLPPA